MQALNVCSHLLLCMLSVCINNAEDKNIDSEKLYMCIQNYLQNEGRIRIEISQSVKEGRLSEDTAKVSFMY